MKTRFCLAGRRLHFLGAQPRAHFFVPKGTAQANLAVTGYPPGETAMMIACDPDGKEVARGDTVARPAFKTHLQVPPAQRSKAWSLRLTKAEKGVIEDVPLTLGQDCGEFVATHPTRLIVSPDARDGP